MQKERKEKASKDYQKKINNTKKEDRKEYNLRKEEHTDRERICRRS